MHQNKFRSASTVAVACLLMLGGCLGGGRTPPTRFYVLNSLHSSESQTRPVTVLNAATIGVGPIQFTQVLDRPQIVTRTSKNEIRIAEFSRWGEPLRDNFLRVLADNLSILLSTERIAIFPWKTTIPITYQVTMEVSRFDGEPGKNVVLRARWVVFGKGGDRLLAERQTDLSASAGDDTIAAMVAAQSRLVAKLSLEIAEEIKRLEDTAARQ